MRNNFGIDKELFRTLKKAMRYLLPEYQEYKLSRKKKYITLKLAHFVHEFFQDKPKVREKFLKISVILLNKMWIKILNVSEENIAGIVSTSTLFYLENGLGKELENLSKSSLCKMLYAKESTVSRWLEKFINEKNKSCVKSKDKIVELVSKLIN